MKGLIKKSDSGDNKQFGFILKSTRTMSQEEQEEESPESQ